MKLKQLMRLVKKMVTWKKFCNFYTQYFKNEDKIILLSLLAAGTVGLTYILINAFGPQFSGNTFVNWQFFIGFPVMAALFALSLFARKISPRIGLVTWTYTTYFFMLLGLGTLVYGTQFTPFHPIDAPLIKIDQLLGFNQTALLNWTYAHHQVAILFNQAYSMIGLELSFIPLVLALLLQKRAVIVLFMAITFSFIVGTAIYYFFPTTAPASMFFDPHFALQQQDTFIKFFEIHHHLPITTQEGGLIAFPSFHVVWCVVLAYALKNRKILFYPISLLNALIIASTMFLGWHYLTDVIGGIIMATLSILISEAVYKKYILTDEERQLAALTHRRRYLTIFKLGFPRARGGCPGATGPASPSPSSSSLKTMPRPFSKA